MTDPRALYESVSWIATIFVSGIFLFYTMLFWWLALRAKYRTRCVLAAIGCFVFSVCRLVILLSYFDNYTMRLILPVTGVVSWAVVGVAGWMIAHYKELDS